MKKLIAVTVLGIAALVGAVAPAQADNTPPVAASQADQSYTYSPNDPIFYIHHVFVDLL